MRTRKATIACGLLAASLMPAVSQAQRTTTGTATVGAGGSVRVTTTRNPLNKVCAELASTPTPLVNSPEGRALVRFKKNLDDAAATIDTRDVRTRVDVERMSEVKRDLDSLMQIVVRRMNEQGRERTVVTIHGSGAARAHAEEQARGEVVATIRSLQPQIDAFIETAARGAVQIPMPTGWMGVYLSSSARNVPSPDGMLTYYCDYPVIEAVHAGSPAEKGGLLAGDTLMAYNGRDVRAEAVNLTKLLVPKQVVRVRFKREGRTREVPLTITPAPNEGRITFLRATCPPGRSCEPRGFAIEIDSVRVGRFEPLPGARAGSSGGGPIRRMLPNSSMRPPVPAVDVLLAGTRMMMTLAGARLSVIGEEFAQGMGVEPGVLVLDVPPGSPASEAGLRPGEVIRALNGVPLRDLAPLTRALNTPGVRQVRLTVNAKGAPARIVTVSW